MVLTSLASILSDNPRMPHPLTITFRPRRNVKYQSRYRFEVAHGEGFDIVLSGHGTYEVTSSSPLILAKSLVTNICPVSGKYQAWNTPSHRLQDVRQTVTEGECNSVVAVRCSLSRVVLGRGASRRNWDVGQERGRGGGIDHGTKGAFVRRGGGSTWRSERCVPGVGVATTTTGLLYTGDRGVLRLTSSTSRRMAYGSLSN